MNGAKGATLKQQNLAAGIAHFFRRRPDDTNGEAHLVRHPGGRQGCAHGRGSDDVVSAGVADPWKAIVFRADADVQRPGAGTCEKRRGQIADPFPN